jgi:hypothetical protein
MKRRRRKRLASKLDAMVRQTEREISRRAFVALIVYSQRLLVGAGMTVALELVMRTSALANEGGGFG